MVFLNFHHGVRCVGAPPLGVGCPDTCMVIIWPFPFIFMSFRLLQFIDGRRLRCLFVLLGLISVFATGLAVRRSVLDAQRLEVGAEMPFTLESALHFRRAKILYDRGHLPDVDTAIQYPEGIRIREIDAVASEPVQALFARFFPASFPFAERLRWFEAAWFCLSLPAIMVAVRMGTGAWGAGWFAALLYAVALSSVLRSTGQEISRENFALPFLMVALAGAAFCLRAQPVSRGVFNAGAAFCSFFFALSLIGWDMVQYVAGVVTLGASIHVIRQGASFDRRVLTLFSWIVLGFALVGLGHPYYRFHGLLFSPLTVWMLGVMVAAWMPESACARMGFRWRALLLIALPPLALLATGWSGAYGASYGHFGELMAAKIKFLNVKPDDPGLLTFYQRIMWVPSLHSATWGLTKWMFPFMVWLVIAMVPFAFIIGRRRRDSLLMLCLLFLFISLLAYVLFVRFHVFVILAACLVFGWLLGYAWSKGFVWRAVAVVTAFFAVVAEANHTLAQRQSMGRPNVYYDELAELSDWLLLNVAPDPVLANMGVSAFVAAYGKCPVAIHPKFEDPSIRRRLEHYAELMFGADEAALRDWMDELGITTLVYAKGEFARERPEYQMRYFVNRMNPPDTVPARRFERDDPDFRYFTRLWGNRKYVVYRSLNAAGEMRAAEMAGAALTFLQNGDLDRAEVMATEAIIVDRHQELALRVLRHTGSLREQGFTGVGGGGL